MRAENFTVAGVMSLSRQICRTSSASAKSDRQSGRSVECALMHGLEAGESGLLGLAQSIAVRALAHGEFAAKKSRCELAAGAVRAGGLQAVLRDEFSLASGEFLSGTAESMMTVDEFVATCANDIGLGKTDGLVGDVVVVAGAGVSLSLRMVSATRISAEAVSSEAPLRSDCKSVSMVPDGRSEASGAVNKSEAGMTPEHLGAVVGFGKVRRVIRASKVKPFLCIGQVFGAGEIVSSLTVPVLQAGDSAKVDTGDFEAQLIACAVDIDNGVSAEEMRSVIRRPAYALSSRANFSSKSSDQWSVQ